ncbi:MAG: hypothetical protein E6G44_01690 [Actinobacteria bacterium]|nr:MAG: hypothetical protein E6G44_01690 [Actinomycetota bacterium]
MRRAVRAIPIVLLLLVGLLRAPASATTVGTHHTTCAPTMTVDPRRGPVGTSVTVSIYCRSEGFLYALYFRDSQKRVWVITGGCSYQYPLTIQTTIPEGAALGKAVFRVRILDDGQCQQRFKSKARAYFKVTRSG